MRNVSRSDIRKYSFVIQNPASLTCESISDPPPIARTINSGLTPLATVSGPTMPAAVVMETVAEPVATRISVATSQPKTSGLRFTCVAMPAT